jgi:hypothetical protein
MALTALERELLAWMLDLGLLLRFVLCSASDPGLVGTLVGLLALQFNKICRRLVALEAVSRAQTQAPASTYPPQLSAQAPVVDVCHPRSVVLFSASRTYNEVSRFHDFERLGSHIFHFHPPLGFHQGLNAFQQLVQCHIRLQQKCPPIPHLHILGLFT